jgi:hypothetical protein
MPEVFPEGDAPTLQAVRVAGLLVRPSPCDVGHGARDLVREGRDGVMNDVDFEAAIFEGTAGNDIVLRDSDADLRSPSRPSRLRARTGKVARSVMYEVGELSHPEMVAATLWVFAHDHGDMDLRYWKWVG